MRSPLYPHSILTVILLKGISLPCSMRYQDLPTNPGCYLFKDSDNQIIYVGKAKNLKKRVSSYFLKKDHDRKTTHLVPHIKDIEYIITDNEVEALLLDILHQ